MGNIDSAGSSHGALVDIEIGAIAAGGVGNKGALSETRGGSRDGTVTRMGSHEQHGVVLGGGEAQSGSRVLYTAAVIGTARIEAFGIRAGDTFERGGQVCPGVATHCR